MIRSITLATVFGAFTAAGIVYAVSQSGSQSMAAVSPGPTAQTGGTKLAIDDWPVCTSMGTVESETDWAKLDPDFAAGKKALGAEDWNGAIAALKLAALCEPGNADIHNYIGYAYRRLRQPGPAMGHYQQALRFNPRHRGAHEHLGELFLMLGEPTKAEEHLAALETICLIPCDEFGGLARAIAAYRRSAAR